MQYGATVTCGLLAGVACSSSKPVQPPSVASPPRLTFASPAAQYNEPTEPPVSSTLGDLVLGLARDAAAGAGRPTPVADERLFLATAALASVVSEDGTLAYPVVEFAMQTNGIIEPSPYLLVVWGGLYEPGGRSIADMLRPSLDQIFREGEVARIGVGAVVRGRRGYGALVVALLASRIRTSPIPRAVAVDGGVDFELTVQPGLHPQIGVILPAGNVERIRVRSTTGETYSGRIECGGVAGKLQVEILGANEQGAESLAKFPIWCGVEPPHTITIGAHVNDTPADPADAERELFEQINRARKELGRPALRWDEGLATIARQHSQDMRRTNVVAHTIPGGLSIEQRVRATRSDVKTNGNVARVYSIREAHQGFMDLPSTRVKLIASVATQIGVGVAYGQWVNGMRELYVTEVVAVPAAAIDPWQ